MPSLERTTPARLRVALEWQFTDGSHFARSETDFDSEAFLRSSSNCFAMIETASSMENALIDARSDILNLRRPVDLVLEVTRLRETLADTAEG